jgi:hypothetical protein
MYILYFFTLNHILSGYKYIYTWIEIKLNSNLKNNSYSYNFKKI